MVAFNIESWVWYSVAISVVACRTLSRTILFKSIKKLQLDDWLMFVVICTETIFIVTINIASHTSSNLLAPGEDVSSMSPGERADRIYGSKLVVVVEQMQCLTIWLTKACLLILYHRLTLQLRANLAVKALAAYTVISFLIMEILYFGVWCRPFHNYWAMPTPNIQCSAATDHLITNAVFNLSSDIAMLLIGFSLFIGSHLPWDRKLILSGVFGLGVFVILCSVLNKYYSFSHPFGSQWTYWYVRESSTAIIVANLPFTWTLIRRMFPALGAFESSLPQETKWHSSRSARGRRAGSKQSSPVSSNNGSVGRTSWRSSRNTNNMSSVPITIQTGENVINKHHSWKDQGVFGRADVDALSIDLCEIDSNSPTQPQPTYQPGQEFLGPGSYISKRWSNPGCRMKLRDEEAQYTLQETMRPKYRRLPTDDLVLSETKAVQDLMGHKRYLSA